MATIRARQEPAADAASGSKPEHETKVADAAVVDEILRALGLEHLVAFEKHCANYRFTAKARDMLATVVTVPEIDGTFVVPGRRLGYEGPLPDRLPAREEPPEPDRKDQQLDYYLQQTHLAYGDRLGADWARR